MDDIRDRIDPLIAERAPWAFRDNALVRPVRTFFEWLLRYDECIGVARDIEQMHSKDMVRHLAGIIAKNVTHRGLSHVPASGPALIVANHPTGIADGVILQHVMRDIRDDAYVFANADIVRVLPNFETMIAPVEWREEKRSRAKTRETMIYTRQAVEEGRLGIIFPSGRLSKRVGLRLKERPWMSSAAMIARKFDLPIIPVNIRARNSSLFYLFDVLHPTLRDITLFYETINKDRHPFHFEFGEPISAASLPKNSEDGIALLKREVLALGRPDYTLVHRKMRPASALF
ncbi:MAG: 1-acyl-sn-glycerol-3-phosphate acyltransferase [Pseudomonadota bacterium]